MQLIKDIKLQRVKNAVAAGQTEIDSDIVDRAGFDGVLFLVLMGAITSGGAQSAKVQQNTANSASGMADLADSGVTIADDDDNQIAYVDVYRPEERYLRCVVLRATQDSVCDGILAILYNAKNKPTTQDVATILGGVALAGPAEGTA